MICYRIYLKIFIDLNIMLKKNIICLCETLTFEQHLISDDRKLLLQNLASLIQKQIDFSGKSTLHVICTHNSRRSQLGELWLHIAALYLKIPIQSYSGGSEATALNYRIVNALQKVGFEIQAKTVEPNPKLAIQVSEGAEDKLYFSKVYHDEFNPQNGFIALIVCNNADLNCPVVKGADHRIFIPYVDPGSSDGTETEEETYLNKIYEIGREMLYAVSLIPSKASK